MDNFFRPLAPRPSDYGGLPGKIVKEDDAGGMYDETGRLIFNRNSPVDAPETWVDTAVGVATAPAKFANALMGSLSPYGQDGWQVPPIISEPAAAFARSGELTGFGDDGQFYLPNVQNPQVAGDTLTQLMTVYGGNALNPLARVPKGAVASGLMKQADNALPMDQASRLARAAEQGYSPVYHATQATHPFDAFEVGRETFNSDVMGNPQATNRNAIFATPDVGFANHFADDEMAIMPLMAKLGNVFDATGGYGSLGDDFYSRNGLNQEVFSGLGGRDAWQAFDGPDGKAFADALKKDGYNAVKMQEELANGLTPERVHSAIGGLFLERAGGDVKEAVNLARAEMMSADPKHAKTYEKVIAGLTSPTKPKVADTFAILDPSNIRSVNAAFDPARSGENGLLLSDNKPSLLGSALASGHGDEDILTLLGYR